MRILIIGPGKMKYMPYAHFYLDNIDRNVHDTHVAYWNRDEKEEDLSQFDGLHLHEFKKYILDDYPLWKKLRLFYSYRRFCISLIKKYEFDYIIVLHSIPAVVLCDWLTNHYRKRFIFDYRDSTYEPRVKLFKNVIGRLINFSQVTFTSSDGFREYFPDDCQSKVITSHNLLEDSLSYRDAGKSKSDKIRIAFWGFIRHIDINKFLIDRVGHDNRFELHYYGREQYEATALKEYTHLKHYTNIFFHGEYKPIDRYTFASNTDLIHNIYHDANMLRAMGNKYYDGIIFRIPQICFPNSQMAKMCESAGVGASFDPRENDFCETLYAYYHSIDHVTFDKGCDQELERVMSQYKTGSRIIRNIFKVI